MDLSTGRDSPVIIDSLACRFTWLTTLQSAGTRSPAVSLIISPGTTTLEGRFCSTPSLIMRAVGAASSLSAARAFSARNSWTKPSTELITSITRITIASVTSLINIPDTRAAAISIHIIKSLNCDIKILKGERPFFSSSSFGPIFSKRSRTAVCERPVRMFVLSSLSMSADCLVCQKMSAWPLKTIFN